jgi:hypothetical protein
MFAPRYFAPVYFAPRYFPPGADDVPPPFVASGGVSVVDQSDSRKKRNRLAAQIAEQEEAEALEILMMIHEGRL